MAPESTNIISEFETFAAPLVQSGRYASSKDVLHAAMDALVRSELDDQAFDEACERAAEEGEASGIAEGDVIARIRKKHGFGVPVGR